MDPDRGPVTHRGEAKDFITHSNNGRQRMGSPMPGYLKPISTGQTERGRVALAHTVSSIIGRKP